VRTSWRIPFRPKGHEHVLIACFPKSGSTYLSKVLRETTGLPKAYVSEPGPQNEQDLAAGRLRRVKRRSVLQQHVKATRNNLELLREYRMRPIVQTRNLFDVVASLHDHFQRDHRSLPCGYISEGYLHMPWDERLEYLIHVHLPWYFNFALSWCEAARQIEVCAVTYEQFFSDQAGELQRIAGFYGLSVSQTRISAAIAKAARSDTRFNVGVIGRGAEMLGRAHKDAIRRLANVCGLQVNDAGSIEELLPARARAA
jgi:hypothetical protein